MGRSQKAKGPLASQEVGVEMKDRSDTANSTGAPSLRSSGRNLSQLELALASENLQKTIQSRVEKKMKLSQWKESHRHSEAMHIAIVIAFSVYLGLFISGWEYFYELVIDLSLHVFNHRGHIPKAVIPIFGAIFVVCLKFVVRSLGPPLKVLNADLEVGINKLSWWRPIVKMIGSAVTLGTGNSLGPEGPCVEYGGIVSMLFARLIGAKGDSLRPIFAAGCAAGLAAGFNAPISALIYGVESVMRDTKKYFSGVLLMIAAPLACAIKRAFFGSEPKFAIPSYSLNGLTDMPHFILLGVCGGIVSNLFHRTMVITNSSFEWKYVNRIPPWLRPTIGAVFLCVFSFPLPDLLFFSYDTTAELLADNLNHTWVNLLILIVSIYLKIVATCLAVSSGLLGGVFAPNIYTGALVGSSYALFMELIGLRDIFHMPGVPAFALVGMACLIAGACNCPYTSIVLLFEMTRDYRIILPLIIGVAFTWWTNEQINRLVSYMRGQSKGASSQLSLGSVDVGLVHKLNVSHVMRKDPYVVPKTLEVSKCGKEMTKNNSVIVVVVDQFNNDNPLGVLSLDEVAKMTIEMEMQLATSFSLFDKDGSGSISFNEFRSFLREMGIHTSEDEIQELIKLTDKDGDGQIQYEEFAESADRLGIPFLRSEVGKHFESKDALVVDPNQNLLEVANLMMEKNINRVPVVDKIEDENDEESVLVAKKVLGTLTFSDIIESTSVSGGNSIFRERFF